MSETGPIAERTDPDIGDTAPPVALVTGAARGIGRAIAFRLARDGWNTLLLDRDEEGVADTARALGQGCHALAVDLADEAAIEHAMTAASVHLHRLDALVCNAGIMIRKPIETLSADEFRHVLAINLTSTFLLVKAAAPLLRRSRGAVVTIASTRARMSEPDTESYAASKGGLVALTHALAVSLGPEVRVNAISPGWIDVADAPLRAADHEQHPAGRVGTADDVAALAAFLLGPESGFVTGAEFVIDGGMTRKMIYEP